MGTRSTPYPPAGGPERRGALLRIRRFAVPRSMIECATERRLAGDWRGACTAANIDVRLDPERARREHGAAFADALLDDLRHLVPDLVRWHFPRQGDDRTVIDEFRFPVLSRPGGDRGPWLVIRSPRRRRSVYEGGHWSQRLVLELADHEELYTGSHTENRWGEPEPQLWAASRYLWDSRSVGETRERWGGNAERAPFLNPDGTPRTVDEIPTADPGHDDPAARTEWIDHLHQNGGTAEALAAAGITPDDEEVIWYLRGMPLSAGRWRTELDGLAALGYGRYSGFSGPYGSRFAVDHDGRSIRLGLLPRDGTGRPGPALPQACRARPIDIDVLRNGFSPDHLHPVVRDALAPARPPADGPVGPPPWEPVAPIRARCGREWHTITLRDGRLDDPHTEEERLRERALQALGGTGSPCFRTAESWRTGQGWLPKALRARRTELFERIRHGDTGALLDYLDTGGDPRVRDAELNTLLHELHHLDHTVLLPRLLAAGLDVNAENQTGWTPVHRAVRYGGTVPLVRALIGAGARTRTTANDKFTPKDLKPEIEGMLHYDELPDAHLWEELLGEL